MQRRRALRRVLHVKIQTRGFEQRLFLLIAGGAQHQKQRRLRQIEPLALQLGQPGLPSVVDVGKRRNVAFQPEFQRLVEHDRDHDHQQPDDQIELPVELRPQIRPLGHPMVRHHHEDHADDQKDRRKDRHPRRQRKAQQPLRAEQQPTRRLHQRPQRVG